MWCWPRLSAGPTVTNDGVTVAREIDLEDPFENLGAQLVKSVATKTNDVAGDGTTTATVLAQAIIKNGLRNVAAGANPIALGSGISKAADAVSEALLASATPVSGKTGIAQVATVSSRDEQIGELVGEAMTKVGHDGVVSVEESSTLSTELEFTEGVGFDKGFLSAYFVTDFDAQEAVLEDALILLHRDKISSLPDLLPLLEKVAEAGKPLLVIAEDVEGEPLSTLVVNAIRKTLKAVAVKAPFFGDRRKAFLEDLAIVTGAQVVNPDVGLVLREVGPGGAGLGPPRGGQQGRHRDRRRRRHRRGHRRPRQATACRDREHRLRLGPREAGGAAGQAGRRGCRHQGRRGHRDRAQGAQRERRGCGCRRQGCRRGGHRPRRRDRAAAGPQGADRPACVAVRRRGARRARCSPTRCSAPLYWIAANAGLDGSVVVNKVAELPAGHGFNAATLTYGDLVADGVIDPVKVTRSAVLNAASVARMVLTTETAIVEKPADDDEHGHGHHHGHAH